MIEAKKAHWEMIKPQIIPFIPKEFIIAVEGLEEEESEYFHPVINLEDEFEIKGQCDLRTDHVYAWTLDIKQKIGLAIHTISFQIGETKDIEKVLANWDKYKEGIVKYTEINKKINENIAMLQNIKSTIENTYLLELFTEEENKKCLEQLFKVKEWIENNRIIENYSRIN